MEFIGNAKAVSFLRSSLKRDGLGHAYLFSGPEHVGKSTLAKMFAQGVISGREMESDVLIQDKDARLDLLILKPEIVEKNNVVKQRDISVESVRDAQQSLSLFPYHGKRKVLIIEDAHKLNTAAQNALLKTLEEPPSTVMIILVTHEPDHILPTIQSRCQIVNFSLVEDELTEEIIPKGNALMAMGRPGLAFILKNDEDRLILHQEASRQLQSVRDGSLNERFKIAEDLSKDIVSTIDKLTIWIWIIRKKTVDMNDNERLQAYATMELIQKAVQNLKNTNASSRLLLETLFMDMV